MEREREVERVREMRDVVFCIVYMYIIMILDHTPFT